MSSLRFEFYQVGKRKIWHYRFRIDGVRTQRSTKTTDRAEALRIAEEAYEAALKRSRGEEPEPTVQGLVQAWLQIYLLSASVSYSTAVERVGRLHLFGLAQLRLSEVTTKHVEEARVAYLQHHKMSSANTWLTILRMLFGWAVKRKMIRFIPWEVSEFKIQKKPKVILSIYKAWPWLDEVDRVSAKDPGIGLAIRIMMGIGLREDEACRARWEWCDLDRAVYQPGVTKGREAKPRAIPPWLVAYLRPLAKPFGWICAAARNGRPVTPQRVGRIMDKASASLEIVGLTPHRLRGTYANWLKDQGVHAKDIQDALGHATFETTEGYLEDDMEGVRQAHVRMERKLRGHGRESGAPKVVNI